jgi:predicted amidohydrolase
VDDDVDRDRDVDTVTVLRVALAQLDPIASDASSSLSTALDVMERAAERDADVILFPEMWQIGYRESGSGDTEEVRRLALESDDPWLARIQAHCRTLNLAAVITFLRRRGNSLYNAAQLVDRSGSAVLDYDKVHTCVFGWETFLTPGDEFPVADLQTAAGPVKVGLMICYDREFPESARELMLGGAEAILTPNACNLADEQISQLRSRAFENMTAMVTTNYSGPTYGGRSCAFSGIVVNEDDSPADQTLIQLGHDAELGIFEIDLHRLRRYRATKPWADCYRRPSRYRRSRVETVEVAEFLRARSGRSTGAMPSRPSDLFEASHAVTSRRWTNEKRTFDAIALIDIAIRLQ